MGRSASLRKGATHSHANFRRVIHPAYGPDYASFCERRLGLRRLGYCRSLTRAAGAVTAPNFGQRKISTCWRPDVEAEKSLPQCGPRRWGACYVCSAVSESTRHRGRGGSFDVLGRRRRLLVFPSGARGNLAACDSSVTIAASPPRPRSRVAVSPTIVAIAGTSQSPLPRVGQPSIQADTRLVLSAAALRVPDQTS